MDEKTSLLKAVCESPEDDVPRLVYADWLEEHDGEVDCECVTTGACGRRCSGTRRVPNHYAKRAEFIRVQCELNQEQPTLPTLTTEAMGQLMVGMSRLERGSAGDELRPKAHRMAVEKFGACVDRRDRLKCREYDLLIEFWTRWFTKVEGLPNYVHNFLTRALEVNYREAARHTFRRGFVEVLTLPARSWIRSARELGWFPDVCGSCGGTGYRDRVFEKCFVCDKTGYVPPTTVCPSCKGTRGRINPTGGYREFSGSYETWEDCRLCQGTGRVEWAFPDKAQPLREVHLTTVPNYFHYDGQQWVDTDMHFGNDAWHNGSIKQLLEKRYRGVTFDLSEAEWTE